MKKMRDWWDDLNDFEQFWLFWFAIAFVGCGVILFVSQFL